MAKDLGPALDLDEVIGAYYQGLHGVTTYGTYSDTKAYVKAVSAQERKFAQ